MKRTLLELGGKSPQIVFADADRAKALRAAMQVWTFHSGQICIAGTRLLVEDSIYDEFVAEMAEAAAGIKIGDPRDADTVMGPVISAAQRDRVERYVATGIEEGAVLVCGGKRPAVPVKGYYCEPTLLAEVRNDMRVATEEIFGPVITAIRFRNEAEAIALANDSEYGLYGYVWSGDTTRALRVARALRTGSVQVNGSPAHPDAPFGGYKMSGIGRDGGRFAMQTYTELKYIGWKGE
jgi:acyl-CoA reductase-like NAD-dependent aldehyde dehydrogenase